MLNIRKIILLVAGVLLLSSAKILAQKKGGHHHHHGGPGKKVVVVKRSRFRPAKVVVYHPYWGPKYNHHRRWVYFPGYNVYWDHWRGHWMFWNGAMWISQAAQPPVIVNVNMANEKNYELKEDDDDNDDVYNNNNSHKDEYKKE